MKDGAHWQHVIHVPGKVILGNVCLLKTRVSSCGQSGGGCLGRVRCFRIQWHSHLELPVGSRSEVFGWADRSKKLFVARESVGSRRGPDARGRRDHHHAISVTKAREITFFVGLKFSPPESSRVLPSRCFALPLRNFSPRAKLFSENCETRSW